MDRVTISALHQMKRDGRKIVAVVAWDFQIAQIADRVGVEIVSVGDSVGVNLWGHADISQVTLEEMLIVCKAVRRGTKRALVSCDLPASSQHGPDAAVRAASRLVEEAGADMIKVDRAADFPEMIATILNAGIPVFAEFELDQETTEMTISKLVAAAQRLEAAGACLVDFKRSGPVAGPAVVDAVSIPVLGGLGGGPWLDGRIRLAHGAIGYAAAALDGHVQSYANVARVTLDALTAYAGDVREGRPLRG